MSRKKKAAPHPFGPIKLGARFLTILFLVLGTYNPSGRSYVHWTMAEESGPLSLQIATGLLVIGSGVFAIRLGTASIGRARFLLGLAAVVLFGMGLRAAFVGPTGAEIASYVTLAGIAAWLTLGISWSSMRRRLTGQSSSAKV